jgi:hypothetical protein
MLSLSALDGRMLETNSREVANVGERRKTSMALL